MHHSTFKKGLAEANVLPSGPFITSIERFLAEEVQDWLGRLKPDLARPLLGRCRAAVESTHKGYLKQAEETVNIYLDSSVDLDLISEYLNRIGVPHTTFLRPEQFVLDQTKKEHKVTNTHC
ncbi:hypothetical protein RRG08_040471 [Elysia crispata]|uniref:Uncharacterized protein n=1 Tax=Elysia crispata TaxID=231223 RepID=A0AAE1DDY0_9GAST|nr:hypothetical protein RRG08_040471 [Elysia crispata]